jgi:hypothetical protein
MASQVWELKGCPANLEVELTRDMAIGKVNAIADIRTEPPII